MISSGDIEGDLYKVDYFMYCYTMGIIFVDFSMVDIVKQNVSLPPYESCNITVKQPVPTIINGLSLHISFFS